MVPSKKVLRVKQFFQQEKTNLLTSAALTIPLALLVSFFYYSISGRPYSISHVLRFTFILSFGLFWVIWWIVNRYKSLLKNISDEFIPRLINKLSIRGGLLAFLILILTTGLISTFKFPQFNNLALPNYKYLIEISPSKGNTGDICIVEIKNSFGNVFGYNETILNAQNSGSWKRDVQGCDHFIEAGGRGKISFENTGPVDDKIEISVRSDTNSGTLIFKSQSSPEIAYDLRSEGNRILQLMISPIDNVIGNYANSTLRIGYISIYLVLSYLIALHILLTQIGIEKINRVKQKLILVFNKIWLLMDTNQATLVFLFIAGVLISTFIFNPLTIGPAHYTDETRYWGTALSLYKGTFSSLVFFRSPPFYPISLLPAFYLFYPFGSFQFSKFLNALYLTSAIIPAYLILRKFTKRNISIVAITLLLLNPVQFLMPGRILSENVFYPLFMWTVLFSFTNVWSVNSKNKVIESLIFGVLLGLLFLTRYIALSLIPAFLLIWWLKPFENEKPPLLFSVKKSLLLILVLTPLILMMAGWIITGTTEGLRVKDMLGLFIAESPNPDQLSFSRLIMWTVFYCSYAILIAAPYLPFFLANFKEIKLRDWQEDSNRWIVSVGIIILFLLVACIRHSWKINYNYPTPLKIQGRYLLYFGPLFLITFFTLIRKPFKNISSFNLIFFSGAMITVSYAILFLGFIFLGKPLSISPSSPDGEMISVMGKSFLILTLGIVFLSSLLFNRKRIALITIMVTFLFGFFIYGNAEVFHNLSNLPKQSFSSQIYHLMQEYKTLSPITSEDDQERVSIYYPEGSTESQTNQWRLTLDFGGYTNIKLVESVILENDHATILQARDNNYALTLRELTEKEFLISDKKKYRRNGKFFEFQLE